MEEDGYRRSVGDLEASDLLLRHHMRYIPELESHLNCHTSDATCGRKEFGIGFAYVTVVMLPNLPPYMLSFPTLIIVHSLFY